MTMYRLLILLLVMGGVPELAGQVQPLWTLWYDGMAKYDDYPAGMAVDSQDNVIVGGSSHAFYAFPGGGRSDFDYVTVKYTPSGHQLWETRYDDPTNHLETMYEIGIDGADNTYLLGTSGLVKQNSNGERLWVRILPFNPSAMAVNRQGDVYLTGFGGTLKLNTAGDTLWTVRTNGGSALVLDSAGNAYVSGIAV